MPRRARLSPRSWRSSTRSRAGSDGSAPFAGATLDAAGNIYGTTGNGGTSADVGTAYELTLGSNGWTETRLHAFTNGSDGGFPEAGVILDKTGNIYGTTYSGGASVFGVVFALKAPAAPAP